MDFYIFDLQFNYFGVIDDYVSIPLTRNYTKKTNFEIELTPSERNLSLAKKDRLITKSDDLQHAYMIDTVEFDENVGEEGSLKITVFSLHHLLKKRIVLGQQSYSGTAGEVMNGFVNANAVNPADSNRIIPHLVIAPDNNIGPSTTDVTSYQQLDDCLFDIAKKHNLSWDILFDYDNKQYVFKVWQGIDRSELQSDNQRVVFAKEFDNVISQNYINSNGDFRNVAVVAGEGDGVNRKIVTVNNARSGFDREELYVDARDLQSSYQDDSGQTVTVPEADYLNLLTERGYSKLSETQRIETLDSKLDPNTSFVFGEDYDLGDIVSAKNTKLGLAVHTRIVETIETYSKEGYTLKVDLGSNIPTLIEKIKKMR